MRLIELLAKGLGKVWSFLVSIGTICVVAGILLFGMTIFMPEEVLRAFEIVKSMLF